MKNSRWLLVGLLLSACHKGENKAAPPATTTELPKISVSDRAGLLFTYFDDQGHLQTAEKITAIPLAHRDAVRVIDLSVPPEARGAGKVIVSADLRSPRPDGTYPFQLLSALDYDHTVSNAAMDKKVATALAQQKTQLTLYSTAWCGVCAKTREYLDSRHVAYVERDVEKDEAARAELMAKAQQAGVKPQGVPVIDVYGDLMLGFDVNRLDQLLSAHRAASL